MLSKFGWILFGWLWYARCFIFLLVVFLIYEYVDGFEEKSEREESNSILQ